MHMRPLVKLPGEFEFMLPGDYEFSDSRDQSADPRSEATTSHEREDDPLTALRYAIPLSIAMWVPIILLARLLF